MRILLPREMCRLIWVISKETVENFWDIVNTILVMTIITIILKGSYLPIEAKICNNKWVAYVEFYF